jgi:hypothetical protein
MNDGLFLICGDDDYLVEAAARERIEGLVPAQTGARDRIVDGRAETGR